MIMTYQTFLKKNILLFLCLTITCKAPLYFAVAGRKVTLKPFKSSLLKVRIKIRGFQRKDSFEM